MADRAELKLLFQESLDFCLDHFTQLTNSDDFVHLGKYLLIQLLQSDRLNVPDELFVLAAISKWSAANQVDQQVVSAVRFSLIGDEELEKLDNKQLIELARNTNQSSGTAKENPRTLDRLKDIELLLGYARLGCEDELKFLVEKKKINVDSADTVGHTSLHNAAIGGYLSIVNYLLANGATVDSKIVSDNPRLSGATPLAYAIKHGHTNVAEILIERGADIGVTVNKVNLLHTAIYYDNPRIIEFLLGKGFDVNQPSGMHNSTALIFAAVERKYESFRFLLEKGANYRNTGHSDLLYVVIKRRRDWCIELLLKHVETREGRNGLLEYMNRKLTDSQSTALHLACSAKNHPAVIALIKYGADIKLKDTEGRTPLDLLRRSKASRTLLARPVKVQDRFIVWTKIT